MATPNLSSRIDKLVELLGAHDRALPTTAELALAVYATAMEGDIFEQFISAAPGTFQQMRERAERERKANRTPEPEIVSSPAWKPIPPAQRLPP